MFESAAFALASLFISFFISSVYLLRKFNCFANTYQRNIRRFWASDDKMREQDLTINDRYRAFKNRKFFRAVVYHLHNGNLIRITKIIFPFLLH